MDILDILLVGNYRIHIHWFARSYHDLSFQTKPFFERTNQICLMMLFSTNQMIVETKFRESLNLEFCDLAIVILWDQVFEKQKKNFEQQQK